MASFKVLIFPCQTAIAQELRDALATRRDVEVCCANSFHTAPDCDEHYYNPDVEHADWIEWLNQTIDDAKITHIFPAHDQVLYRMSRVRDEINAKIVTSPQVTTNILRFKSKTYNALRGVVTIPYETDWFPMFAKPDQGQGGIGARVVYSPEQITNKDVVTGILPGKEYTVDCLSDRDKGLVFCSARERNRIRGGIAVTTEFVQDETIEQFRAVAEKISKKLEFHGAWHFQMKEDRYSKPALLEVAARIASASSLVRSTGVNLPYLSLLEADRMPFAMPNNRIPVHRAVKRHKTVYDHELVFESLYVDLDDTLVLKGKVNDQLVGLLYKYRQKGIPLFLLTKSQENPLEVLRRHTIHFELFTNIFWLTHDQKKADYITEPYPLLIDDSFAEREAAGAPAISCDMLELIA